MNFETLQGYEYDENVSNVLQPPLEHTIAKPLA